MKVKYPHLLKLLFSLCKVFLAVAVIQNYENYTLLNLVGCLIVFFLLDDMRDLVE